MITDRERKLAQLNRELANLEQEKKDSAAEFQKLITEKKTEIQLLATEIIQGKEELPFSNSKQPVEDARSEDTNPTPGYNDDPDETPGRAALPAHAHALPEHAAEDAEFEEEDAG